MKWLILLLAALGLGGGLGYLVVLDPGYSLFAYQGWTVEMPLWLCLLLLVVLIGASHLALWALRSLVRGSQALSQLPQKLQTRQARFRTTQGFIELAQGHWKDAEDLLVKAAKRSDTPLLNYLAAARAAQGVNGFGRRDKYLRLAHESSQPSLDLDIAVGLTQAQLQLSQQQNEQALATLQRLHQLAPRHGYVLKLLARVYQVLKEWVALVEILPALRKSKVLSEEALLALSELAYVERMRALQNDFGQLQSFWGSIPDQYRHRPALLGFYVERRLQQGDTQGLDRLIQGALLNTWDDHLVALYGQLASHSPSEQLQEAEQWLTRKGNNPVLLLCLGRLCLRNKLWGKARAYFESAVQLQGGYEAYAELGRLLEALGEETSAQQQYQAAIQAEVALPDLPMPSAAKN